MLQVQALRALSSIYPLSEAELQQLYPGVATHTGTEWEGHQRAVERLSPRWDSAAQAYVARSGR